MTMSEIGDEILIWWHFDEVFTKEKRMMTLSTKKNEIVTNILTNSLIETTLIFGNKYEIHHYEMVNGEAQR